MADIDDFDIDRSIASAWAELQNRLSEIISMIDDSGDLTVGTGSAPESNGVPAGAPRATPFLRFSSPAPDLLRCEVSGHPAPGQTFCLTPAQSEELEALGWRPPTDQPPRPTADYWYEAPQEESDRVSALAVAALRDVFGVLHPIFLAPDQLTEVLQPTPTPVEPPLNEGRAPEAPDEEPRRPDGTGLVGPVSERAGSTGSTELVRSDRSYLDRLVDAELTRLYGHPPIRDVDGDIAIRVGSTMVFLRTAPDGQEVVIFAAVVHEVAGRSRAAEVLNDLNVEARWVKFQLVRDRVFVTFSILARPFVAAHLAQALRIMSEVADAIDDELAAKLHGRTTFPERDDPPAPRER